MGRACPSFTLLGRPSSSSFGGTLVVFGVGGRGVVDRRLLGGGSPRYLVDGFLLSAIAKEGFRKYE